MAEAISKTALVDQVAEAAGISKKDTKAVIDALLETVKEDVRTIKRFASLVLVRSRKLIAMHVRAKTHARVRCSRLQQAMRLLLRAASNTESNKKWPSRFFWLGHWCMQEFLR